MRHESHGDTGTRLYNIWKSMRYRCNTPKWRPYQFYGARGIKVCEEWDTSYTAFKAWAIVNGYDEGLELDRINVNGNYEPSNCKWVTHHEQTLNRRDTLYLVFTETDERVRLYDFCKERGINYHTVNMWRLRDIEDEKLSSLLGASVKVVKGVESR